MKLFAVLAAVLAVAAGAYSPVSTWTLVEIEAALQDPSTDPATVPYLIDGLNTIVANLYAGIEEASVVLSMPVEETVTLDELTAAIHDPSTNPAVLPYYENALQDLMVAMINGQEEESIVLSIPAMNVNVWSLDQLSDALQNPETDPELLIYLEYAMNQLLKEMFAGGPAGSIAVITPPGVIASVPEPIVPEIVPAPVVVQPEIESPSPVIVAPEVNPVPQPIMEVPQPIIEAPQPVAETPTVASAPLVQLIVNVNAKQQETVAPSPVANPTPVVHPTPAVHPTPVISGDEPYIAVGPWA